MTYRLYFREGRSTGIYRDNKTKGNILHMALALELLGRRRETEASTRR